MSVLCLSIGLAAILKFTAGGKIRPIAATVRFLSSHNTHQPMLQLPTVPSKRISRGCLTLEQKLVSTSINIEKGLDTINADERDDSFRMIRSVASSSQEVLKLIRVGEFTGATGILQENKLILSEQLANIGYDVVKRESKFSYHIERFGTAHLLLDFFGTGRLSSPTTVPLCNDEEYIAASIGWAQELSRYALQRAIDGDIASVEIVRGALTELHQALLTFDFRNGSLRRRYDGMKYYVKTVEDITYELSLLPGNASEQVFKDTLPAVNTANTANTAATNETAISPTWQYIDGDALVAIQQRMAAYDQQRELVIKEARDIQKLSKQAIFSIIRGQSQDARQKLAASSKIIERLFVVINSLPALRPGSFSNSLEEWCEAQMLLDWCEKKTIPDMSELPHNINASEYIGGLSDLTGELGRLAVMLAAKRDIESVQEIMEVDSLVYDCIARVHNNNSGANFSKKLEAVQTNLRKVEDLVFELTIMERSGRMKKRMRLMEESAPAPASGQTTADD